MPGKKFNKQDLILYMIFLKVNLINYKKKLFRI